MQNRPLEQWQIDHIRKIQEELGLPNAEEVTMDEDTDEDMAGGLPQAASVADATAGGLSVYKDPNVQRAQTTYDALAKEQMDRYTALERAIAEKRYGPSFSERMFQLSAALAAPTTRRGFGGILENVMPVLAAQEKAQRQGEISRREALEQLEANRLAAQMGLAKQDLTTQLAMARINAAANKPKDLFRGAVYVPDEDRWAIRPGAEGGPPVLTPEQAAEYARDPKNRGMKFYTTDGRPMEIK